MHRKAAVQKSKIILLVMILLCACFAHAGAVSAVDVEAAPLTLRSGAMDGMVRVYLSSLGNPASLDLTVRGNYSLSSNGQFLSNGSMLRVDFNSSTGALTLSYNGQTYQMGRQFSLRRHNASGTNGILIHQSRDSQNPYPGDIEFKAVANGGVYKLYTIAHIYIENYLYGVLPYEMGNSSGMEALKAQAVAARTYTVRMMQNRSSGLYDVQDTTNDQTYRGTPSGNANCVAAVDATKGIVLMYGSSYITTYYGASNGGQTEIPRTGTTYGYMKVKDDPFDYANTSSTVKKKTIYANLQHASNPSGLIGLLKNKAISRLSQNGYRANVNNTTLLTLKSVTPHTPLYASPSRLYTKMDFTFTVSTQNASGLSVTVTQTVTCDIFDELESLLSMNIQSLDNELWSVEKGSSSFELQARRYGHGMGMSQRGAMQMARLGYTYDQILGFYYDGSTRVKHSFTNSILNASSSDQEITVEPPADLEQGNSYACAGTVRLASSGAMLAIRALPSNNGRIIGSAGNGAIVEVLTNDGSWCQIRFGQLCGYIPASAISLTGQPSGQTAAVTSVSGFATVTANDYVNLRASGSMSGRVVGTAPRGAVLTVFSIDGAWAKVQFNGLAAYVNTGYVSQVMDSYPSGNLSSGTGMAYIRTESGLGTVNLRSSASMTGEVIIQIPSGAQVRVYSDDGSWCQVDYQGMTGYVSAEFISESEETDDDFEDEPEIDDGWTDNPADTAEMLATVATEYGSLNMREEAYAGSRILTTIPKGTLIEVIQRGDPWSNVYYQGMSGYVMSTFLAFDNEMDDSNEIPELSGALATVVTPSGTLNLRVLPNTSAQILALIPPYDQVTVLQYGDVWCQVEYQGILGYVMTTFLTFGNVEEPEEDNDSAVGAPVQAVVTTGSGSLNLRMEPSLYGSVVGWLPRHATVDVLSSGDEWCYVSYQGQTGYAMTAYLTFRTSVENDDHPEFSAPSDQRTATVETASGGLNLRVLPGSSYRVLTTIPRHALVVVTGYDEEWCAVEYSGYTGYVMTRFLRFGTDQNDSWTDEPEQSFGMTAWVSTVSGSLNLRQTPSLHALVLAAIPQYAQVNVLEEGNEWSQIVYQGQAGYVMTRYLTAGSAPSFEDESDGWDSFEMDPTLEVLNETLYAYNCRAVPLILWAACSEQSGSIGAVGPDEEVEILMYGDTWCCVKYGNMQGYCMTQWLELIGG